MSTTALRQALDATTEVFERLDLRYALVGGLAVSVWGPARATKDIDLYAELPTTRRADVREELVRTGFDVPARGPAPHAGWARNHAGVGSSITLGCTPQAGSGKR